MDLGQRAVCLVLSNSRARFCNGIGLEHGFEDHNDTTHHCDQRDFFELAVRRQRFINCLRIELQGIGLSADMYSCCGPGRVPGG